MGMCLGRNTIINTHKKLHDHSLHGVVEKFITPPLSHQHKWSLSKWMSTKWSRRKTEQKIENSHSKNSVVHVYAVWDSNANWLVRLFFASKHSAYHCCGCCYYTHTIVQLQAQHIHQAARAKQKRALQPTTTNKSEQANEMIFWLRLTRSRLLSLTFGYHFRMQ